MSIEELIRVAAPPATPIDAGPMEKKRQVEHELGVVLPDEIYNFAVRYGSGRFGDTIEIYNPFSPSYISNIKEVTACYQSMRTSEGESLIPYPIYPDVSGLFPWGDDVNGHMLFWLTQGQPSKWPLVLMRSGDIAFQEINMSAMNFLSRVFKGEMSCIFWDKDYIRENFLHIRFVPKS